MKRFFSFIEIKTKITSIFPFFMTMAWLFVLRRPIRWLPTGVFFASMFCFDLTTTAINNYIDSRNNGQVLPYERKKAFAILLLLLALSVASGLYLVILTDAIVLITGAVCFAAGILYTYGPVPISATPLGELLSGVFYGFFIPFLLLYINLPQGTLLTLSANFSVVSLAANVRPMAKLLLFAAIPTFTTANIMLANNACDAQKDISVKRYTLPYYLGRKALFLFAALYALCYLDVVCMVLLHIFSPICLIFLLTWIVVQRNIGVFLQKQEKETTFITSIQNYIVINGALTVLIFLSGCLGCAG